jgi:hypothetical protein
VIDIKVFLAERFFGIKLAFNFVRKAMKSMGRKCWVWLKQRYPT